MILGRCGVTPPVVTREDGCSVTLDVNSLAGTQEESHQAEVVGSLSLCVHKGVQGL